MEILLIRHGQSENNARPARQRIQDPSLTDVGYRQAALTGEWLAQMDVDRLLTSAFLRTLETTDAIRRATGLVPQIWPEIHEQGGCISGYSKGTYKGQPGMSAEDLRGQFPGFKFTKEIGSDGWWKRRPYESIAEATERSQRILARMRKDLVPKWRRVAVVSHGTIVRLLINTMFGERFQDDAWHDDLFNTSVTTVSLSPESVKLVSYNCVGHLPRRLHTN